MLPARLYREAIASAPTKPCSSRMLVGVRAGNCAARMQRPHGNHSRAACPTQAWRRCRAAAALQASGDRTCVLGGGISCEGDHISLGARRRKWRCEWRRKQRRQDGLCRRYIEGLRGGGGRCTYLHVVRDAQRAAPRMGGQPERLPRATPEDEVLRGGVRRAERLGAEHWWRFSAALHRTMADAGSARDREGAPLGA